MYENIRELGLNAARKLAGEQAVRDVAVTLVADWTGRPSYRFTLLVDQGNSTLEPGPLRIRLTQKLTDVFAARTDEHATEIEILDPASWGRRAIA